MQKLMAVTLNCCKVNFLTAIYITAFSPFKYPLICDLVSNAVFCSCSYNGETDRHLNGENVEISPSIKKIKPSLKIFVSDYIFICDHFVSFDEFNILAQRTIKRE